MAYSEGVDSLISLRYPNGRIHLATLTTSAELKPGYEFDLHGRHWNAIGLTGKSRAAWHLPQRMLCVSTERAPTLRA